MAADVLVITPVTRLVDDGRKLVTNLVRDGFDVAVAFWVRRGEQGPWHFYIASSLVIPGHLGALPSRIYDQLQRITDSAVEFSQIRLIPASDPAAVEAIQLRDRPPGGDRPFECFGDVRFGGVQGEWSYIYERISAALTRDEVIQRVVQAMNRTGYPQPFKFTLRDGSSIPGIPVGLQLSGGVIAVLISDPTNNAQRSVPADEVVSID